MRVIEGASGSEGRLLGGGGGGRLPWVALRGRQSVGELRGFVEERGGAGDRGAMGEWEGSSEAAGLRHLPEREHEHLERRVQGRVLQARASDERLAREALGRSAQGLHARSACAGPSTCWPASVRCAGSHVAELGGEGGVAPDGHGGLVQRVEHELLRLVGVRVRVRMRVRVRVRVRVRARVRVRVGAAPPASALPRAPPRAPRRARAARPSGGGPRARSSTRCSP